MIKRAYLRRQRPLDQEAQRRPDPEVYLLQTERGQQTLPHRHNTKGLTAFLLDFQHTPAAGQQSLKRDRELSQPASRHCAHCVSQSNLTTLVYHRRCYTALP